MSLRLLTKPMTIHRRTVGAPDGAGRPTATIAETEVLGGISHSRSADSFDGGLVIVDEVSVYLDPTTEIAPGDFVEIDGARYEVISEPFAAWNHRRGSAHHLEVKARRAER
jgi:hypothetical protein